jgi:hypothetical protein
MFRSIPVYHSLDARSYPAPLPFCDITPKMSPGIAKCPLVDSSRNQPLLTTAGLKGDKKYRFCDKHDKVTKKNINSRTKPAEVFLQRSIFLVVIVI